LSSRLGWPESDERCEDVFERVCVGGVVESVDVGEGSEVLCELRKEDGELSKTNEGPNEEGRRLTRTLDIDEDQTRSVGFFTL